MVKREYIEKIEEHVKIDRCNANKKKKQKTKDNNFDQLIISPSASFVSPFPVTFVLAVIMLKLSKVKVELGLKFVGFH